MLNKKNALPITLSCHKPHPLVTWRRRLHWAGISVDPAARPRKTGDGRLVAHKGAGGGGRGGGGAGYDDEQGEDADGEFHN